MVMENNKISILLVKKSRVVLLLNLNLVLRIRLGVAIHFFLEIQFLLVFDLKHTLKKKKKYEKVLRQVRIVYIFIIFIHM